MEEKIQKIQKLRGRDPLVPGPTSKANSGLNKYTFATLICADLDPTVHGWKFRKVSSDVRNMRRYSSFGF